MRQICLLIFQATCHPKELWLKDKMAMGHQRMKVNIILYHLHPRPWEDIFYNQETAVVSIQQHHIVTHILRCKSTTNFNESYSQVTLYRVGACIL